MPVGGPLLGLSRIPYTQPLIAALVLSLSCNEVPNQRADIATFSWRTQRAVESPCAGHSNNGSEIKSRFEETFERAQLRSIQDFSQV